LAEHSVELEVERQYPDLQIGPGYGEQDGDRQFVLGLGIALPIFNANRQAIAEAIATREVARASAENAVESLLAEIAAVEIEWRASSAHRTLIAEEILPLMEAQDMDVRRLAQLGGEIDALILLESLKREHEVRLKLIETTHAESRAALRIMEIAGPRVPECAGASESTSTASATTTVAPRMSETTP
jgi:outer membrane protein TolC